jgi:hypothetical protein
MGITWFSPSHRISLIIKAPEEQKHAFSSSSFYLGLTMLPFVVLSPNF